MTGPSTGSRDEREIAPGALEFEREDVNPGVVAKYAIALGAVSVVVASVCVWLLVFLRRHEASSDPARPALFFSAETRQPEGVRLQTTPFTDIRTLREQERQILGTYGWVDEAAGVVHIPITEAMRIYVERQGGAAPTSALAGSEAGVPTDSAPVPSPAVPVTATTPLPAPQPSPLPSGSPAPPAPHGAGPTGAHR
jgi:hypothetical protein